MEKRNKEKHGGRKHRVVFWIAIIVAVAALVGVGVIGWSYWHAANTYHAIAKTAFGMEEDADDAVDADAAELAGIKVDWDYLRSVNPDVVAWIYMPGTVIDYPIVHTGDNTTYLHEAFGGDIGISASSGTIFLDAADSGTFQDANNIMYGHHMNDGSMFACLSKQLSDEDEFNANRIFYVFTPTMNYRCRTFSLVLTDGSDQIAQTSFASPQELIAYIQDKESRSVVQPSEGMPDATKISTLFTLSTCDYNEYNGRALLFARVELSAEPNR